MTCFCIVRFWECLYYPWKVVRNSEGEVVSKAKVFKESMKLNWRCVKGGGYLPMGAGV